jgi:hypothetical protein
MRQDLLGLLCFLFFCHVSPFFWVLCSALTKCQRRVLVLARLAFNPPPATDTGGFQIPDKIGVI